MYLGDGPLSSYLNIAPRSIVSLLECCWPICSLCDRRYQILTQFKFLRQMEKTKFRYTEKVTNSNERETIFFSSFIPCLSQGFNWSKLFISFIVLPRHGFFEFSTLYTSNGIQLVWGTVWLVGSVDSKAYLREYNVVGARFCIYQ